MPTYAAALVWLLPVAWIVTALVARHDAGPFWIWRHADPDYYYLLDGLNVATLTAPGHLFHPGVPLDMVVGLVLRVMHPFADGDALAAAVLGDPEFHLAVAGTVLIAINGLAMLLAGRVALAATGSRCIMVLVQFAPFVSLLTFKFGLRVKPEALLITVTVLLAAAVMAALRPGELEHRRTRYAVLFGMIVGLGVATKITAAPVLALLPAFVLARPRALAVYAGVAAATFLVLLSPAAPNIGRFADWIGAVSVASGDFGTGTRTVIDPVRYLEGLRRMLSRTAVAAPLIVGFLVAAWAWRRERRGMFTRRAELLALTGYLVAVLVQGAVIAKQASGHYMIPAYALGGLGLALAFRVAGAACAPGTRAGRIHSGLLVLTVAALVTGQAAGLVRADRDYRQFRDDALVVDGERYDRCARVFYYLASDPYAALVSAHRITGGGRANVLRGIVPPGTYRIFSEAMSPAGATLAGTGGEADLHRILAENACVVFRGGREAQLRRLLNRAGLDDLAFDDVCRYRFETVRTIGIGCPDATTGS